MTRKGAGAEGPLSYNAALVLQAIVQGHRYGFEIMRAAHLKSGTVYPLLRRLEAAGLVASEWEEAADARDEGRPPRRYYAATRGGPRRARRGPRAGPRPAGPLRHRARGRAELSGAHPFPARLRSLPRADGIVAPFPARS